MNQSENLAYAMPSELIIFFAKVQGAGAAVPVRCPTTVSSTSFKGFMHASNNFVSITASDITRSGAGVYTAKLRDSCPVIDQIVPELNGTDGKWCQVTDYNPTTKVISFQTFSAVGAATDIASTDFITFTLYGQKNLPVY